MKKYQKKYIIILLSTVLVFLIGYNIYKGQIKISFLQGNSVIHKLYYCNDSSYTLTGNSCTKNIMYQAILLGDANLDNIIDIEDINNITEYLDKNKELNSKQLVASDTNLDGIVDMNDISIIQEYLNHLNNNLENFVCEKDFTLKDKICEKKITLEAKELKYVNGDINRNSKIDANDLILLQKYLKNDNNLTEIQIKIADYNEDNKVNNKDYNLIKKLVKSDKGKLKLIKKDIVKINDNIYLKMKEPSLNVNNINYYIDIISKEQYFYKFVNIANEIPIESSDCKLINNNINYHFVVNIVDEVNYGKIIFYNDMECKNQVAEYNTFKYKKTTEKTEK